MDAMPAPARKEPITSKLPDFESALYQMLRAAARDATRLAYCPYSRFPVGAALLATGGTIWSGANFETVTLSQTIHAEEVALSAAISGGVFTNATPGSDAWFNAIEALAVYAPKSSGLWPCGNCRATLSEVFRNQVIIAITGSGDDDFKVVRFNALIPFPMGCAEVLSSLRPNG